MTLELFLVVLCVLLAGVTIKTLILYASMRSPGDHARHREDYKLARCSSIESRMIQLEADVWGDDSEGDDYEAPALTPYGEIPGWKGVQDEVQ